LLLRLRRVFLRRRRRAANDTCRLQERGERCCHSSLRHHLLSRLLRLSIHSLSLEIVELLLLICCDGRRSRPTSPVLGVLDELLMVLLHLFIRGLPHLCCRRRDESGRYGSVLWQSVLWVVLIPSYHPVLVSKPLGDISRE
jgi:hypothetical protein